MNIAELPVNFISSTLNQLVKGYKWFVDGIRVKYIEFENGVIFDGKDHIVENIITDNLTVNGEAIGITKEMVGLSNVDNTSDINKPISNATSNAIGLAKSEALQNDIAIVNMVNLKAPLASPTFTGEVNMSDLKITSNEINKEVLGLYYNGPGTVGNFLSVTTGSINQIPKVNCWKLETIDLSVSGVINSNEINSDSVNTTQFICENAGMNDLTFQSFTCNRNYGEPYGLNEIGYLVNVNKSGTVSYSSGTLYIDYEIFQSVGSAYDVAMVNGVYIIYIELYVYSSFEGYCSFKLKDSQTGALTFIGQPYVNINPRDDVQISSIIGDGAKFTYCNVVRYISTSGLVRILSSFKSHRSGTLNYGGCLFKAVRIA